MKALHGALVAAIMLACISDAHAFGAKPRKWCGWWMRQQVAVDPGPAFNLAANWAKWGRAVSPMPGAIMVERHHVSKIVQVLGPGRVIAISGNDGNRVRTRERSTRGAIAFRM